MTVYNDEVSAYITELFAQEDEALGEIRRAIPERGLPEISIKPEEGRFLQLLVRAADTLKALEIGTLGGYSGTWIARGLAPGGRLISLEKEAHHAEVAREHFRLAGVEDRVEIIVGDAHELLKLLDAEAPFDVVFIDAEKSGYGDYLTWALDNVRIGGLIIAHNALQSGEIVHDNPEGSNARAMQGFNRRLAEEPRVIASIYPGGDGMVVAVRVE